MIGRIVKIKEYWWNPFNKPNLGLVIKYAPSSNHGEICEVEWFGKQQKKYFSRYFKTSDLEIVQ